MRSNLSVRPSVGRLVALALAVLSCGGAAVADVDQPTAEDADQLRLVKTLYGESLKAIKTIEFEYTSHFGENVRMARYARDGDRVYTSGIYVLPDGSLGMPHESAWDGQRVFTRPWLHYMSRSTDKHRFQEATPVPQQKANYCAGPALGLSGKTERYRFLRARKVEDEEHGSCIELEFFDREGGGQLLTRHARQYHYAPVYSCLTDKEGKVATEIKEMRYARVESDGNALFYPVALFIPGEGGSEAPGSGYQRFDVDEKTLKINQPIPRSRFVLEPWPSEKVYDWEKKKMTPAREPDWSPVGKVGFPWNDWARMLEENDRRKKKAAPAASAGPALTGAVVVVVAPPWQERVGAWLALPGIALVTGGGYLVYRRRHPRSQRAGGVA
jgi:hypothetical protein